MAENVSRPSRSPLRQLLAWVLILGLGGLALWLASKQNARRWVLVPEEGQLVVKKGLLFPAGRGSLKSDDPHLLQLYAPIQPPPGAALPPEQSFDDRSALDQALYDVLSKWARDDIAEEKPEPMARGLGYLSRAERLPGISAAQREDLKVLRAEYGFHEARQLLERGANDLRLAREKLKLAADSPGRRAGDALLLLRRLEPLVEETHKLSRSADQSAEKRAAGVVPPPPAPSP
jgi:hypothetical protein